MMSSDPTSEEEFMYGWLICRFDRKQVHSILYGQFSKQPLPPPTGWVFLAKNGADESKDNDIVKLSREGLEGNALSLFAKGLDYDEVLACANAVSGSDNNGISVTPDFLQNDQDPGAAPTRYYVLHNCPIPFVNGRYMDGGFHEGAPVYRNVREWALVRTKMAEIPELGINAKGSYAIQEGSSISEIYHEAAALAYKELLQDDPKGLMRDGSYEFKKRFSALSRAGNRMITSDQSEQVYFVDQKRAALRTKLSASLLSSLQEVRHANTAAGVISTIAEEEEGEGVVPTTNTAVGGTFTGTSAGFAGFADFAASAAASNAMVPSVQPAASALSRSQVLPYMNETLESCAPDTIKSSARTSAQLQGRSTLDEEMEKDENETFSLHSGSQHTQQSGPKKKQKRHDDAVSVGSVRTDITESVTDEVGVEIDITLGRSISYQHGSQAFVLHQLGSQNDNSNETKDAPDDIFLDAEAELALEVTTCIEERESALNALRLEAAMLQRTYLSNNETTTDLQNTLNQSLFEGSFEPATTNGSALNSALHTARSGQHSGYSSNNTANFKNTDYYLAKIENLLARMRDVRRLTIAFADAFGAWARLLHKQKAAKWARDKRKAEQFGASHKKLSRTYTVLIAYRSAKELYPLSQAVHSTTKKFSRGMEPVKYATETKLIGVFDTKEEAISAFDKAFSEIPQEYVLLSDTQAVNKRIIGLRKCGQHYWVRSSGVAQDMACEQCSLQRQLEQERDKGISDIYKEEPISQYIWKGQNYLEKMWSDLDFLSEVEYLRKALPDENFHANPLLLGNESIAALLGTLHRTHKQKKAATAKALANRFAVTAAVPAGFGHEMERPKHVLSDLRGKKELLKDAARAGERQNALIKQQQYDALYKDNPYNNTANFGSLTKKSKHSASHGDFGATEGPSRFSVTAPPGDNQFFSNNNNNNIDTFTTSDVHLPPDSPYPAGSSVFYETTVGSVNSEFGQTVAVREMVNLPDGSTIEAPNSTPFGAIPDTASPNSANFAHFADPSLLTAPTILRTSRSAASHLFPDSSVLPQHTHVRRSTSATVAGNGAVGVKGIKSASEKAKKHKLGTETSHLSAAKKAEIEATNKNRTVSRGLNANTYLPEDLRQSSRALPPASKTVPETHSTTTFSTFELGFPGTLPRANHVTQLAWDRDFLSDADAHMERLARALQLIGQCPVPANDVRSDNFVSEALHAGAISSGPDHFSATENAPGSSRSGSHVNLALSSSVPHSAAVTQFGSSVHNVTRLPPEPTAKLTLVETFYTYRGAQMSLLQERRAVAHRTEETFCRSDVGEWKGFRKGRAMRAFEFQENLYLTGKKKEEARKDLQQLIRTAIAVDIIECDVPYVTELIEKAHKIRGSMLALDIAQAELFLRRYAAVCHFSLRGQAWFRGCRDRRRVKEMRRLIREAKKHHRTTEIEAAKLAITWVGDLLQRCVRTRVQQEKRSVFRFTLDMSGVHCMISMRRQPLPARKPVAGGSLCMGCQTQCIVTKFEPSDRTYSKDRAPCTCVLREPVEQWQLSIYNPLTRQTFRHVLDVTQVRQMLRGVEWAAKVMRSSAYAQAALQGDSFGHLSPLFNFNQTTEQHGQDIQDDAFSGRRMDRSFSNALLRASEESAVLPGMPLTLPPTISHVINESGMHEYQASEYFRTPFGGSQPMVRYDAVRVLDGRRGVDSIGTAPPHWAWHPLVDITKLKVEIGKHQVLSASFREAFQAAAAVELECAQKKSVVLAQLERVQMVYEDARTVLLHASDVIQVAQDKIEQVMRYCKKLQTDVEKEEKGEQIDDRQSYDQLEDANMWIGMNEKRRLEKLYAVQISDFNSKYNEYRQLTADYTASCAALLLAQETHQNLRRRFESHLPQMSIRKKLLRELQVTTRAAAAAVLSTFSLPRKYPSYAKHKNTITHGTFAESNPEDVATDERIMPLVHHRTARRLQRLPWNLIFVREPLERLRLPNRGAMTVLQRRIMKLRPQQATLDRRIKSYLRCVVLVLLDEVTGNIIVHIGQDERSVEESNQHSDLFLQKSDFSELTTHGLDNEIILRPEDVEWILSIPVELSAANINRANRYAKGRVQGYTLDPNRVPEDNKDNISRGRLVLPSQAIRPLQGVTSYPNKNTKLGALLPTYLQRRDDKEEKQVAQAGELLKYLRLQAHTGRPCVGLLHFKRRLAYSHKHIQEASWLSDLVNVDPLMLINHVSSRAHMWNDRIVMTHTYNTLRRFQLEVHLPFPAHPSVISTEVPTAQAIASLLPRPLLLANFLWEFVTNSFSPQTLHRVMEGVDWQLPGQLDNSFWRKPFPYEVPRPRFMFHASMQYRGPVYQRHRFVSSKYFLAKLYLSAQDDMLIVLCPPIDGKFFHHQFHGEALQVHISRSELYAVVAKVSVQAALVPREMLGTLLLLHPQNLHVLFSILLELLHLSLSQHKHQEQEQHQNDSLHTHNHHGNHHHQSHGTRHTKHSRSRGRKHAKIALAKASSVAAETPVTGYCVLPALSEESAQSFDVAVNVNVLFQHTSLLYDKYNHWVQQRHSAFLESLGEDARSLMRKEFLRLAVDPSSSSGGGGGGGQASSAAQLIPYSILTHKDPSNKQQMRVYHSVWSFLDIGMYYGDPLRPVAEANALKLMNSRKGATFMQLKNLRERNRKFSTGSRKSQSSLLPTAKNTKPFPSYTLGSECFDSLMAVEVLTNISKTTLLVDIYPIDLSHADAQSIVSGHEQDLFALEDERANKLRRFGQVNAAKRLIVSKRSALQAHLNERLLPEQETLSRRQQIVTSCIKTMHQQFLAAYEEDQQRRAAFVLNAALGLLLNVDVDASKLHIHKTAMARALGTVLRVPPHLQRNQLFVDTANWMNETLRQLRKTNATLSPASVRLCCVDPEGSHHAVPSKDIARENHFPGFTTDTVPRYDAKLRDFHEANAMAQLGSGFRDPDRWYHAKKLNSANQRHRGLASYRAFLDLSATSQEKEPLQNESWPVGKPAAFVAKEWRGKRLVSATTLRSLLKEQQVGADSSGVVAADSQYLIKDSFVYSSGAASIDLYCLQTCKIIHLYAHCEGPAAPTAISAVDSLIPSVRVQVRERADVCKSLHTRVQSVLEAEAEKLAAVTSDIETAMTSLSDLDRDLFAVTYPTAPVADTDTVVAKYNKLSAGAGMSASFDGATFSYMQKDQPTEIIFSASPKTKSSKRRHRTRTSSSDLEMEASAKINKKESGFELPIVAFFVPRDESHSPQLIRTAAHLWHTVVANTLGASAVEVSSNDNVDVPPVLSISRRISPFGLVYYKAHSHQSLNARVHRLFAIMQSQATNTTTVTMTTSTARKITTTTSNAAGREERAAAIHGDALILLRHGTKDMLTIEKALLAMQLEYAPMKALRALKEGKERQWRLSNHASFRQIVFGLAFSCLNATEDWYGVLKPSLRTLLHGVVEGNSPYLAPLPGLQTMPLFPLRLMLTKFNDLQRCLHAVQEHCTDMEKTRSWRTLEYFGVLDYCTVCIDDATLLHFDEKCPTDINFGSFDRRNKHLKEMLTPVSIGSILRDILSPVSELEKEEYGKYYLSDDDEKDGGKKLVITVGQVVYAMYQLHVYNCQLPIPLCKFPGCGRIRAEAAAASSTTCLTKSANHSFFPATKPFLGTVAVRECDDLRQLQGSGLHPIDLAIKEFFFTHKETFTKQPPVYLPGHRAPHAAVESVNGKVVVNEEDSSDDEATNAEVAAQLREEQEADISIADEILQEQNLDQAVIATRDTNALLQLDWRALKKESELMYTLHNAMVRPEVANSVTPRDLLMAKGGIHALGEEAAVKKMITRVLVTHSSAAHTDYVEYDNSGEAAELLRLVPSAALRAEMAAAEAAEQAERTRRQREEDEEGDFAGDSGNENESATLSSSSESSSGSSYDSDETESGGSEDNSQQDDDAFSVSTQGTEISRMEKLDIQTKVHVKQTHAIPIHILRALSSAALQHLAVKTGFDPYPVHKDGDNEEAFVVGRRHTSHQHIINAMPPHMYQLLMQRLRLTRPERIPNLFSFGDRTTQLTVNPAPPLIRRATSSMNVTATQQHNQSTHYFRFDRLHHEQVVILQDGSVVVMQFMYGILAGASLVVVRPKAKKKNPKLFRNDDIFPNIEIYEAVSGAPPAAIRFLHTSKLPTLKPGLTVAVFDALSSVSRAFIVEERSMQRTCEAFGVVDSDLTALSRKIAAHAHHCVQLTRAGFYCTTVMFSLASLVGDNNSKDHRIESVDMKDALPMEERDVDRTSQVISFEIDDNVLIVDDNNLAEEDNILVERPAEGEVPMAAPAVVGDVSGAATADPGVGFSYSPRYVQSHRSVLNRFSALQALLESG